MGQGRIGRFHLVVYVDEDGTTAVRVSHKGVAMLIDLKRVGSIVSLSASGTPEEIAKLCELTGLDLSMATVEDGEEPDDASLTEAVN